MARRKDKEKALKLRLKGLSYSQIKEKIGISKSTLSGWLYNYPLSSEKIKELRDRNPRRIENYRNTMRKKREDRLKEVYQKAGADIGKLNKRELFLCVLFLYWGEGLKTSGTTAGLSNTDPVMICFFLEFLYSLGVKKEDITITMHLYSDMDVKKEISFWLKELNLPKSCLRNPSVKKSKLSDITYKNGYGHGTCHIRVYKRDLSEYILMGLKYLKDSYRQ